MYVDTRIHHPLKIYMQYKEDKPTDIVIYMII